jgi:hypothetical protein
LLQFGARHYYLIWRAEKICEDRSGTRPIGCDFLQSPPTKGPQVDPCRLLLEQETSYPGSAMMMAATIRGLWDFFLGGGGGARGRHFRGIFLLFSYIFHKKWGGGVIKNSRGRGVTNPLRALPHFAHVWQQRCQSLPGETKPICSLM